MRRLFLAVLLFVLAFIGPVFSQQRWERTYGGTSGDFGRAVQQTLDGGYIVAGETHCYGNNPQVYLIKTNASGDTLWTRNYWKADHEYGWSVQQTSDTGYVVAGGTYSPGDGWQVYLIKTNASGDTLWTRTYGRAGDDEGYSVQRTTDGGYIVAGWTNSYGNGYQVFLVKTNASGDTLWTRTYGGTYPDQGYSVQQTSDGGYIIAGRTGDYPDCQVYLVKTNASGDTLWSRNYGGTGWDWGYSVQQTSDGGYIIAGETDGFGNGYQVYLIKADANGSSGIEENAESRGQRLEVNITATPNPFISFATVPGHSSERFSLYDISGRRVGTYKGDRIGEGLRAGVYFLRAEKGEARLVRVVKVR